MYKIPYWMEDVRFKLPDDYDEPCERDDEERWEDEEGYAVEIEVDDE